MYKTTFKLLLAFLIILASQIATVSFASNISEYKIKAAFIYNFARFTQWPDDTNVFKICIYGENPFGSYIDNLNGKKINHEVVKIIHTRLIEEVKSCRIAFLNIMPPKQRLFERALDKIKGSHVLTVADAANVTRFGVMIGLQIENDKVGFEINNTAAKASELKISAQLLTLAKQVL